MFEQASYRPDTGFWSERSQSDCPRDSLLELLSEPCPCDDCPMAVMCASNAMACEDYQTYVITGHCNKTHRAPSKRRFRQTYLDAQGKVKRITSDDRLEAMNMALRHGIPHAAIATGIKSSKISWWLRAAA